MSRGRALLAYADLMPRSTRDRPAKPPLSREAIEEMATPPMPEGLYRVIAEAGFRWQAQKNGVSQHDLRARPLET